MKLFLFDIDGTLVSTLGAGSKAFKKAYHELFKKELAWQMGQFAGRTDRYICEVSLERLQANTEENRKKLLANYLKYLKEYLSGKEPFLLPGVFELVHSLKKKPNTVVALLTGNILLGAQTKLGDFFELFEFGAFGDDHSDRRKLPDIAYALFKEKYNDLPQETFIIGDTPMDIQCARAGMAKAVATATGPYSSEELHEADFVLNDLREWDSNINI